MSISTKRKYVTNTLLDDQVTLSAGQSVVKILQSRGNSLYEAETCDKDKFLVSMPNKFRNTVWIKNGTYVIIEDIAEGNKVKGEIVNILMKHHIKFLKKNGTWPEQFDDEKSQEVSVED